MEAAIRFEGIDVTLEEKVLGNDAEVKAIQEFVWCGLERLPGVQFGGSSGFVEDSRPAAKEAFRQAVVLRKLSKIPDAKATASFSVELPVPTEGWQCWVEGTLMGSVLALSAVFRDRKTPPQ